MFSLKLNVMLKGDLPPMKIRTACFSLLPVVFAGTMGSVAQAIELNDAVEQTIIGNPEVRMKLHQFGSAQAEQGLGRAGWFPVVDLVYTHGREQTPKDHQDAFIRARDTTMSRWGWSANLTQNLFNGFQTLNMVRQQDHAQHAQYFQFLDTSEQQALAGAQAYLDVLSKRRLVTESEANFRSHRDIYQQIKHKVSAGAGRGVDLEQAAGRLALAESNQLTARSNLDDVSARYERVVGTRPPAEMKPFAGISWVPPGDARAAESVLNGNPANRAAREGVRAARLVVEGRRGAFLPTVDARARHEWGSGRDGARPGGYDRRVFELVTQLNLSRGGADKARLGMAAQALNVALDQRDKSCRESRQTLSSASTELTRLRSKIVFLQQHALATEKVRDVYRQQFDIGQRTLLDLLDSENELYSAKSALIEGQRDLILAQLRGAAVSGRLLTTLKLKPAADLTFDEAEDDVVARCPVAAV